jgi:hypothetical protein
VPETVELLLVSTSDHDSYPDYRAFALLAPGDDRSTATAVRNALGSIFASNGDGGDTWALVGGLPSYVQLFPDSPINGESAAELFRSAMATVDTPDYRQEIEDLLRARQDPWGQAADAVTRAFRGAQAQRAIAQIRQLEAGESPVGGEKDDDEDPAEVDVLFDLWFALASQPAHAEQLQGHMDAAKEGARAFRGGALF